MDSGIEFQKNLAICYYVLNVCIPPPNPYVETLTPNGDDTKEVEALRGS